MDKKTSYIILGIVTIIVIGVVLFSLYQRPAKVPPIEPPSANKQTQEDVDAFMRQAIDTQDASFCERMEKGEDKAACERNVIIAEAGVKLDSSICERIEDEYSRTVCKDNVTISLAIGKKDPRFCQNLIDKNRISECQKYITH